MELKRDRKAWIRGGTVQCEPPPKPHEISRRLVLLGAPGVGKGTQAELLCANLGACHLSTGDIFRAAKALDTNERTPALTAALDYMRRGDLVPDETVLALVAERMGCLRCEGGFLLDGFPRTVAQAEALEKLLAGENLQLDAVLSYPHHSAGRVSLGLRKSKYGQQWPIRVWWRSAFPMNLWL